ncbi:LCP family protein [Actinosynnema sp. NPDC020468]|uniref:LCP family protein n=1 Tax=Actinosynnema sp. NPDC020468 TaxID=3154488 RepID=UPI0033D1F92C
MTDRDRLIREAVEAEAAQAVDSRDVLASLDSRRVRRGRPLTLITAAALTAAAVAVVVPLTLGNQHASTEAATSSTQAAPLVASTVLLVGLDDLANADAVVLAKVADSGAITLVSVPRDAWVDVPGQGTVRLGTSYGLGRQSGGDAAGAKALVGAVEKVTGQHVDHYATVDTTAFGRVANAIGGVDVCLSGPARDAFSGADLPAGRQTLTGPQALAFLRQRHGLPRGDLDRVTRQQVFLDAVARKTRTPAVLGDPVKAAALFEVLRTEVRTDPGWDAVAFLTGLPRDTPIRTAVIPLGEETEVSGSGRGYAVDPAEVARFITGLGTTTPTTPPSSGDSAPTCVA